MAPRKREPVIVEPSEFRLYLYMEMKSLGMTVQGFAKHLGVSHQAAYALLDGKLRPSEKILEKVGLEIVFRVRDKARDSHMPIEIPAKSPAKRAKPKNKE